MSIEITTINAEGQLVTTQNVSPTEKSVDGQKPAAAQAETKEASGASESDEENLDTEGENVDGDEDESPEEGDGGSRDPEARPKGKNGFKKRIDRFKRQLSDKDRELEYLRRENENLRSSGKETQPREQALKPESSGKPKVADFETHEEYLEALSEWRVKQEFSERDAKTKATQVQSDYQKSLDAHRARTAEFAKTKPDFEDVISDLADFKVSAAVEHEIINSENGPELLYELAKDPDEFERICSLPAQAAARAIGRLEERLKSSSQKQETKIATTAPSPITTVGSRTGSGVKKDIYDADLSFADYEKLRMGKARAGA